MAGGRHTQTCIKENIRSINIAKQLESNYSKQYARHFPSEVRRALSSSIEFRSYRRFLAPLHIVEGSILGCGAMPVVSI